MKSRQFAALSLVAACAFAAAPCYGAGFLIYDLSGEALGRASAVSADVSDATAVWFNPAALAFAEGVNVSVGGVFVSARSRFEAADTGGETSSDRGNFFLPTLFGQAKLSDRIAVGMGVYSAFGIGVKWPSEWIGRESAISASLRTLAFNPNVALRLSREWSVAAGLDFVRATVDFKNGLLPIVNGDVRIAGGTWGVGVNAALLYRPIPDRFHLALTYRSRMKLSFDGRGDFEPGNPDFEPTLPDQPGHAEITLPDILTAGLMVRPVKELALGLDVNAVLWSAYERIDIDFETAPDRSLHPNGRDAFTLRAGADWTVPASGLHLRGGIIFDRGALPAEGVSPALPDSDRIDFATGLGFEHDFWKADLGYLLVMFLPVDARSGVESPEGTYHTRAHLVGLTLGAKF